MDWFWNPEPGSTLELQLFFICNTWSTGSSAKKIKDNPGSIPGLQLIIFGNIFFATYNTRSDRVKCEEIKRQSRFESWVATLFFQIYKRRWRCQDSIQQVNCKVTTRYITTILSWATVTIVEFKRNNFKGNGFICNQRWQTLNANEIDALAKDERQDGSKKYFWISKSQSRFLQTTPSNICRWVSSQTGFENTNLKFAS